MLFDICEDLNRLIPKKSAMVYDHAKVDLRNGLKQPGWNLRRTGGNNIQDKKAFVELLRGALPEARCSSDVQFGWWFG